MAQSKQYVFFLLTLILHGLVLFYTNVYKVKVTHSTQSNTEVIQLYIKTASLLVEPIIKELPIPSKKTITKKDAKRKVSPIKQPAKVVKVVKKSVSSQSLSSNSSKELKEIEKYALELRAYIESKKFYPRLAKRLKQSGNVEVQVVVDKNGIFKEVHLAQQTRFPILNKAALQLINKLKKFKPLPAELNAKSFAIPIKYKL